VSEEKYATIPHIDLVSLDLFSFYSYCGIVRDTFKKDLYL
jgi:hypothetical protein